MWLPEGSLGGGLRSVVIDTGSDIIKAGFGGEDAPRSVFPSIVGRPVARGVVVPKNVRMPAYVGNAAQSKCGLLSMTRFIENGMVTNWDDFEKCLLYTFLDELRVAPGEHPAMLSEVFNNPLAEREKLCQLMFEIVGVPATYLACGNVLNLCSLGCTQGVNVNIGSDTVHSVPVFQGHVVRHAGEATNAVAGTKLTHYLTQLLTESGLSSEQGYSFRTTAEREIVRDIKEKLVYVANDFEEEMALALSTTDLAKSYELPDGQVVTINKERCGECLFQPSLLGSQDPAISRQVVNAVGKLQALRGNDIHTDGSTYLSLLPHELLLNIQNYTQPFPKLLETMYGNIVLSGGTSMFAGLGERLKREVEALVPVGTKVNVIAPAERKYSTWIGGSILSSLSTFQDMWTTKREYDEHGAAIVRFKCF